MSLTVEGIEPVNLNTSNAPLFTSTKTYYYAGFNNADKIQKCQMDEVTKDKETTVPTEKPERLTPQSCDTKTASEFINTGDPKMNSMNLLVTGLRILLAKCVAVNAMMTVKAFIF